MTYLFSPCEPVLAPIVGAKEVFPMRRIYCVGRNYAAHAREMGRDPDRESPFFFTKWADTYVPSGREVAYPLATENYQYEPELVALIGTAGAEIAHLSRFYRLEPGDVIYWNAGRGGSGRFGRFPPRYDRGAFSS